MEDISSGSLVVLTMFLIMMNHKIRFHSMGKNSDDVSLYAIANS